MHASSKPGAVVTRLPQLQAVQAPQTRAVELTARVARPVNSASGNARPSTRLMLANCWRVMETSHPSTRAVNSGSGNRALVATPSVLPNCEGLFFSLQALSWKLRCLLDELRRLNSTTWWLDSGHSLWMRMFCKLHYRWTLLATSAVLLEWTGCWLDYNATC